MVRKCNVCKKIISTKEYILLLKAKVTNNVLLREWCSEECYKKDNKY